MLFAQQQYEIRQMLQEKGIIFCYSGYMTEAILSGLGQAIKQKLTFEETDTKTVRAVFGVFVEQMQNVIRYSAEREPAETIVQESVLSYGVLTIGKEAEHYFVTCGNKIQKHDVARLNDRLSAIQEMDKDQLKAAYKETLKHDAPEGSKGAGIGFIDIAKKSTQPIEFGFFPLDSDYDFFSLKAYI